MIIQKHHKNVLMNFEHHLSFSLQLYIWIYPLHFFKLQKVLKIHVYLPRLLPTVIIL